MGGRYHKRIFLRLIHDTSPVSIAQPVPTHTHKRGRAVIIDCEVKIALRIACLKECPMHKSNKINNTLL
jgi:hypothetical protein